MLRNTLRFALAALSVALVADMLLVLWMGWRFIGAPRNVQSAAYGYFIAQLVLTIAGMWIIHWLMSVVQELRAECKRERRRIEQVLRERTK